MPATDDNDLEDMASSAMTDLDAAAPEAEAPKPDTANSSDATGETERDTLSVVRDVVTDKRADPVTAPPAEGEEVGAADDQGVQKEPNDEDYSDVPFNKHPRFQQLLRKSKANEADARRYQNVQNFIEQNGVSAEEAAEALTVSGLIKTNPAAAWARIKPVIQKLLVAAGEVLPDDLRDRVQKGEMSHDAALEVSRARAGVQSVETTRSFEQQRAQQMAQQQARQALTGAAETWEADRRAKDPNFEAKLQPLMDRVYALQRQEGIPNTPQGVQDQLNRAYKGLVVAAPKPAIVPPKATPKPVTGGQVAGNQRPTGPMSTLDIIKARVGNRA